MKKTFLYAFILLAIASCKKSSLDSFELEKSYPDADSALTAYTDKIYASPAGWEFQWETADASRIYTGYLNFDEGTGTAKFAAPITEEASTINDVPFLLRVIRANPTLSFAKGSIFSNFVESTNNLDSVFTFKTAGTDTVSLLGDNYGSKLTLVRIDQAVADVYASGALLTVRKAMESVNGWTKYFKRLTIGNNSYDIRINSDRNLFSLYYEDAGVIKMLTSTYTIYRSSLKFLNEISIPGLTLTGLDNLKYEEALQKISGDINGTAMAVSNEIAPVKYDKTISQKFIKTPIYGSYSQNYAGFTVEGKEDAFGITTIPGFNFIVYYHQITGQTYGAVRFYVNNDFAPYGPAIIPNININGILKYSYAGSYGTPPANLENIILNVTKEFINPDGFYVIQPDPGIEVYDLVRTNGNSWIRFE